MHFLSKTHLPALAAAAAFLFPLASALPQHSSSVTRRATNLCGDNQSQLISGTPWIAFNMLYNSADLTSSDSWCTVFDSVTTSASGAQAIKWGSTSTISPAKDTVKGYSFIGLTQGLSATLDSIGSVPAEYSWTRSNTTAFKGNVVFDFMTNDKKGDSTSTDSHELMLWLQYEGGQLPIGFTKTPQKVDNLFGTSWSLYSGKNTDTGITVTSMLADTQFDGSFTGDLMDWFRALSNTGLFSMSTFLNVGNAGTEIFFGDSTMSATLALEISNQVPSSSSASASSTVSSSTAVFATAVADASSVIVPPSSATSSILASAASTEAPTLTTAMVGTGETAPASAPSAGGDDGEGEDRGDECDAL